MKAKALALSVGAVVAGAGSTVAYFEGMIPGTYADPVGIPTICYGHTGPDVRMGMRATEEECKRLLNGDLTSHWVGVRKCIKVPLHVHEAAAITSFAFNVGVAATCQSTMLRLLNAGEPPAVWCAQMHRWVYATKLGMKFLLNGLVNRRKEEYALCMSQLTIG